MYAMSTIVEATVPAEQFALAETLSGVPETEVRMVQIGRATRLNSSHRSLSRMPSSA